MNSCNFYNLIITHSLIEAENSHGNPRNYSKHMFHWKEREWLIQIYPWTFQYDRECWVNPDSDLFTGSLLTQKNLSHTDITHRMQCSECHLIQTHPFSKFQNSSSDSKRRADIRPLVKDLHWLAVALRMNYKITVLKIASDLWMVRLPHLNLLQTWDCFMTIMLLLISSFYDCIFICTFICILLYLCLLPPFFRKNPTLCAFLLHYRYD